MSSRCNSVQAREAAPGQAGIAAAYPVPWTCSVALCCCDGKSLRRRPEREVEISHASNARRACMRRVVPVVATRRTQGRADARPVSARGSGPGLSPVGGGQLAHRAAQPLMRRRHLVARMPGWVISTPSSASGSSKARIFMPCARPATPAVPAAAGSGRSLQRQQRAAGGGHDQRHMPVQAQAGQRVVDRPWVLPRRETPIWPQRARRRGVISS